jgi:hypothetical protein
MQTEKTQPNDLQEGELYVFERGELRHLDRPKDDMPKVPISKSAHECLLDLRRRCRKALGGFRPDVALVVSAIVEHISKLPEATQIVADFYAASICAVVSPAAGTGADGDTQPASSLASATASDDAPSPLLTRVSA